MIAAGARHRIVWGGGERLYRYGIKNTATLLFEPPNHGLTLANVFVQDTMTLAESVNFILGIKLEDDPFSGWTPLPDARLSIGFGDRATVWAAASRAIRSPTPFDNEVVEKVGGVVQLEANTRFRPEEVIAYEVGTRAQPSAGFSLSVAAFYNVYDDLRTVEPKSATVFAPLYWGNFMRGDTYGIAAWANWQLSDWWRLSPGLVWVRERLEFKPGASQLLGVAQAGDDPSMHASLTSSMSFPHRTSFDATLRYVGALPSPVLPHYYELNARFGWQLSDAVEISLSGTNLLHERHAEWPLSEQIPRSGLAELRWKF
jgi:iron complex outermembrane receptor protein